MAALLCDHGIVDFTLTWLENGQSGSIRIISDVIFERCNSQQLLLVILEDHEEFIGYLIFERCNSYQVFVILGDHEEFIIR